ncbi:MAG TPA: hypothetical protein VG817_11905 [Gemmatimonadales bacterium]|nr:hypothetical protein [Gemmatimonadales bacterium]
MPIVTAIRRWLEGAFPESNVRLEEDTAHDLSRFLIEDRAGGRARVFEVSAITLRQDPDGVVRFLREHGVASRLREAPTWRARLGAGETLEYFQQMQIRCDGKSYHVRQNAQHQVSITDARDRPLTRSPAGPVPFEGDITTVPATEWHTRIRTWRGTDQ